MKRIMSILLVLSILLVGCGGSSMSAVVTDTAPDWWPTQNKYAALFPIPNFEEGEVYIDNDKMFDCAISNVSAKEYRSYVEQVLASGYSDDYTRNKTFFRAKTSDNKILRIEYIEDESVMSMRSCNDEE